MEIYIYSIKIESTYTFVVNSLILYCMDIKDDVSWTYISGD